MYMPWGLKQEGEKGLTVTFVVCPHKRDGRLFRTLGAMQKLGTPG